MPASSWVPGADGSEFPLENLPFGVFSHAASGREPRIGVAIGGSVLDMKALLDEGLLDGCSCSTVFANATLNAFMAQPRTERVAVRELLTKLLDSASAPLLPEVRSRCLVPVSEVVMHLPAAVGDYTDFYSSREHATNVGIMFRGKDNALQPNWLHLPVGYHGRASSVVPSGTSVVRPKGQLQLDKTDPTKGTEHAPCRLMDFELEMGFFVGGAVPALAHHNHLHATQRCPPIAPHYDGIAPHCAHTPTRPPLLHGAMLL
jgi:fumarylacetoacetase